MIIDHASRYMRAIPVRNKKADTIADAMWDKLVSVFGFPKRVTSDQGSEFVNKVMERLLKRNGIEGDQTAAYYHRSNGLVERANRTVLGLLRKSMATEGVAWDLAVPGAALAYNSAFHSSTGASPFFLMFGKEPNNVADFLLDLGGDEVDVGLPAPQRVYERLSDWWEARAKEAGYEEASREELVAEDRVFKGGELVFLPRRQWPAKSKLWSNWTGPHEVVSQTSRTKIVVRHCRTGRPRSAHINEIYPAPKQEKRLEPGRKLEALLRKWNVEIKRCFIPFYSELQKLPGFGDPELIFLVPRSPGALWYQNQVGDFKTRKVEPEEGLLVVDGAMADVGTHGWELWIRR